MHHRMYTATQLGIMPTFATNSTPVSCACTHTHTHHVDRDMTLLHYAAEAGAHKSIQVLLREARLLQLPDRLGTTPLDVSWLCVGGPWGWETRAWLNTETAACQTHTAQHTDTQNTQTHSLPNPTQPNPRNLFPRPLAPVQLALKHRHMKCVLMLDALSFNLSRMCRYGGSE